MKEGFAGHVKNLSDHFKLFYLWLCLVFAVEQMPGNLVSYFVMVSFFFCQGIIASTIIMLA